MESEMLGALLQNVSVVVVLGYWVLSERKSHRETLNYYRREINERVTTLEKKIDDLTSRLG